MLNIIIIFGVLVIICLFVITFVTKGNFIGKIIIKLKLGKVFDFSANVDKTDIKRSDN